MDCQSSSLHLINPLRALRGLMRCNEATLWRFLKDCQEWQIDMTFEKRPLQLVFICFRQLKMRLAVNIMKYWLMNYNFGIDCEMLKAATSIRSEWCIYFNAQERAAQSKQLLVEHRGDFQERKKWSQEVLHEGKDQLKIRHLNINKISINIRHLNCLCVYYMGNMRMKTD